MIAELASAQHGVVALWQLRQLGLSVSAVDKRVQAGRLHRVHLGVYAVGHRVLSGDGHRQAAVLACGPDAVLSHRSAAALWGLVSDRRSVIDVTAPGRRGRMPAGIQAHRHGSLRPQDRTNLRGIPCTTVARTLLDLAASSPARELRAAMKEAEIAGVFDLRSLREVVGRSRRRRGVARLRSILAEREPLDDRTRNRLEAMFLALCGRAELPAPLINAPLALSGRVIEPDFLWPDARLIVETDGREVHGTAAAFESDRERDQRLMLAGFVVLRFTWRQIREEPERVIHTVRQIHNRRTPG